MQASATGSGLAPLNWIALAQCTAQAWKNGGGSTQELLCWPAAAGVGAPPAPWALRISVATVDQDGPFSAFPDVQRWFAVLQGQGVALRFGHEERRVLPSSPALCFAGEAAPEARLLEGATLDLNLMARRSQGEAGMERARTGQRWCSPSSWRAVYVQGAARLGRQAAGESNGAALELETPLQQAGLVWAEAAANETWQLLQGEGWWMQFAPTRELQ